MVQQEVKCSINSPSLSHQIQSKHQHSSTVEVRFVFPAQFVCTLYFRNMFGEVGQHVVFTELQTSQHTQQPSLIKPNVWKQTRKAVNSMLVCLITFMINIYNT